MQERALDTINISIEAAYVFASNEFRVARRAALGRVLAAETYSLKENVKTKMFQTTKSKLHWKVLKNFLCQTEHSIRVRS